MSTGKSVALYDNGCLQWLGGAYELQSHVVQCLPSSALICPLVMRFWLATKAAKLSQLGHDHHLWLVCVALCIMQQL